ncbi:MAG TPA: hypothetical protein VFU07_09605 [Candidatus Lumbricidophila sp.]|nr:hypothetical protein [Candidatus Lumbricidophila sp.]
MTQLNAPIGSVRVGVLARSALALPRLAPARTLGQAADATYLRIVRRVLVSFNAAFLGLAAYAISVNAHDAESVHLSVRIAAGATSITVTLIVALLLTVAAASREGLDRLPGLGSAATVGRRASISGLVWAVLAMTAVSQTAPAWHPVPGGAFAAAAILGMVVGRGMHHLHVKAVGNDTYRTFNMVGMVLASGSVASMSLTPTGAWWMHNFSTLGTSDDLAAACFNVGIMCAGSAIVALSRRLSQYVASAVFGARRSGLAALRILITAEGVSLVGVGVVPIDTLTDLHNGFACGAAASFAALALGTRGFARRMPRPLAWLSRSFLVVEVAAMYVYDGLKLYNLTVFEIVAFSLVVAWLVALVTMTGAAASAEAAPTHRCTGATTRRRHRRSIAVIAGQSERAGGEASVGPFVAPRVSCNHIPIVTATDWNDLYLITVR